MPIRPCLSDSAYFSHGLPGRPFAFIRGTIQIANGASAANFEGHPHFKASNVAAQKSFTAPLPAAVRQIIEPCLVEPNLFARFVEGSDGGASGSSNESALPFFAVKHCPNLLTAGCEPRDLACQIALATISKSASAAIVFSIRSRETTNTKKTSYVMTSRLGVDAHKKTCAVERHEQRSSLTLSETQQSRTKPANTYCQCMRRGTSSHF
jgi:hypothetical protein